MSVGTLTVGGYALDLVTAEVPGAGRPRDISLLLQEQLTSPGVDYARWRQLHLRYPPYTLVTLSAFSTYASAVTAAQNAELGYHKPARLTWTLGGVTRTFREVRIIEPPKLRVTAGYIVGGGTSISGAGGLLFAEWQLQHTELSS